MQLNEYQDAASETAIYEDSVLHMVARLTQNQMISALCLQYTTLKMNGEAGEIAEEVGKMIRDDHGVLMMDRADRIRKEIGDVMWYCSQMARELGTPLDDIVVANIEKLRSRQERDALGGSGNER